jgi:hypothetical protein
MLIAKPMRQYTCANITLLNNFARFRAQLGAADLIDERPPSG